ncbi:MAG: TatD family hydrolase [Proteobacteria bacterium]|nr:TatD family hydrolase [Pseudomonadota bacterium]
MKLFDSHCHLDDSSYYKDMDLVMERARTAGVEAIMLVGITEKNSARLVDMAEANPMFYCSVGIHPHDASQATDQALLNLKACAKNPKVKAWGETGLDFARMHSPRETQEFWFEKQMAAAADLNLPLIFHERDSQGRFLEMVTTHSKTHDLKGVVHCFSGNLTEMNAYLDLGLYIGITGILTLKGRGVDLREQVLQIPEDRLLVETDAPYLTPAPEKNKSRRNEPAFVRSTFLKLAELRQDDPERLSEVIWNNTLRLYNIDATTGR